MLYGTIPITFENTINTKYKTIKGKCPNCSLLKFCLDVLIKNPTKANQKILTEVPNLWLYTTKR